MSVFVDTGVFYALQNERAARHDEARDALEAVLSGEYGRPYTSDYVYDEVVTLVRKRTGNHEEAVTAGGRITGDGEFPSAYELLYVGPSEFERTVDRFTEYDDQSLSFTDASTIALVEAHDIDVVLAFDDDFDGLVDRLDPADAV